MSDLGRTARTVRKRLGLTQKAAAESLGVTAVHLSNVERGVTPPSASLISRFAAVFGVDVYVLSYCQGAADERLPKAVRDASRKLAEALERQLGGGTGTA